MGIVPDREFRFRIVNGKLVFNDEERREYDQEPKFPKIIEYDPKKKYRITLPSDPRVGDLAGGDRTQTGEGPNIDTIRILPDLIEKGLPRGDRAQTGEGHNIDTIRILPDLIKKGLPGEDRAQTGKGPSFLEQYLPSFLELHPKNLIEPTPTTHLDGASIVGLDQLVAIILPSATKELAAAREKGLKPEALGITEDEAKVMFEKPETAAYFVRGVELMQPYSQGNQLMTSLEEKAYILGFAAKAANIGLKLTPEQIPRTQAEYDAFQRGYALRGRCDNAPQFTDSRSQEMYRIGVSLNETEVITNAGRSRGFKEIIPILPK